MMCRENSRECHSLRLQCEWRLLEPCSIWPAQQYKTSKNTNISLIPHPTTRKTPTPPSCSPKHPFSKKEKDLKFICTCPRSQKNHPLSSPNLKHRTQTLLREGTPGPTLHLSSDVRRARTSTASRGHGVTSKHFHVCFPYTVCSSRQGLGPGPSIGLWSQTDPDLSLTPSWNCCEGLGKWQCLFHKLLFSQLKNGNNNKVFPPKDQRMFYYTIALISHATKVMLKNPSS